MNKSLVIVALAASLGACSTLGGGSGSARVELAARSGSAVSGELRLRDTSQGLQIRGQVRGLAPNSEHGFHIHDKGDCSAADASSAGGHFNPGAAQHGHAGTGGAHHAGDVPNIKADARGVARVDQLVAGVTIAAGAASVAGRSVVVHRDADDYTTQPAGNSGPRLACGVIARP
jgi:Cu-Zn family superoxide dismutase